MFAELPLAAHIAIFATAAALVWFAGSRLAIRRCDRHTTGIGREFIGKLLLGGIISLPEIAVARTATLQGTPVLPVNDVLGSAAINVLILAIADVATGRGALTSVQGSPTVMLQGVLCIVMMAMAIGSTITGDTLVLGVGIWCGLILAIYPTAIWILSRSRAGRRELDGEEGVTSDR